MNPLRLRGYVWMFCLYLFVATQWLFRHLHPANGFDADRSLLNVIPSLLGPAFCIFICFSMFLGFKDRLDKCVALLSTVGFIVSLLFDLYKFDYIHFAIPRSLSGFMFFLATIVLGYRIDQLLKAHNAEIVEDAPPSEASED